MRGAGDATRSRLDLAQAVAVPLGEHDCQPIGGPMKSSLLLAVLAVAFAAQAMPGAQQGANPHSKTAPPATKVEKVAKATTPDAKTVEEVIAGRTALKDKTVTLRGQVVKVTTGVLNKTWVHLQDGSGSSAKGTHDILVTTTDEVAVGAIVTAQGTVRTDVTIGPGYAYEVLVEGAKLKKS